jgi:hypothetical protein
VSYVFKSISEEFGISERMMTFFGALVSIGNSGGIFEVVGWL